MKNNIKTSRTKRMKINKLEKVTDIFFKKILDLNEALVTDKSYINDFLMFPKENSIRKVDNSENCIFEIKIYIGPICENTNIPKPEDLSLRNNWNIIEYEMKPTLSKKEVIDKTFEVFGVNIDDKYDQPIVKIIQYISDVSTKKYK